MISFIRFQPIGLRIWHWLNAAIVTGLLLTVGLRNTLFSIRANRALFEEKAKAAGTALDPKLAKQMAEAMVDNLWNWHVYLGYALGTALLLRFLVIFIHGESPLRHFLTGLRQYRLSGPSEKRGHLHFTLVRSAYLAFYIAVTIQVASGLSMVYSDKLGISDAVAGQIGEVHETFLWFFLAFIALHIAGVVNAELGKYRGIVSNMIHGGPKNRDDSTDF